MRGRKYSAFLIAAHRLFGEAEEARMDSAGRLRSSKRLTGNGNDKQKKHQSVLAFPCKKPIRLSPPLQKHHPAAKASKNKKADQGKTKDQKSMEKNPSPSFASLTPEKKSVPAMPGRFIMSIKQLVRKTKDLQGSKQSASVTGNSTAQDVLESIDLDSSPLPADNLNAVEAKTPKAADFELPEKYAMLGEFFDSMESAIRLLRLRKQICSFCNICPQVEHLTHKRFMYSHVAQMKYILPEVIQVEKILSHDEKSLCMKPDLKITFLLNALPCSKDGRVASNSNINTSVLRKMFRRRLLEFVTTHPKGDDVPEEILPEPFNRKKTTIPNTSVHPLESAISSPSKTAACSLSIEQRDSQDPIVSSLFPKSFQRCFSQRTVIPEAAPKSSCISEQDQTLKQSEISESLGTSDGCSRFYPCSVSSHFPPGFKSRIAAKFHPPDFSQESKELKKSQELDCKLSPSISSHQISPRFKRHFSAKTSQYDEVPFKVPNAKSVPEAPADSNTPCKIPSGFQIPKSTSSTPWRTCERLLKDCFSPSTPVTALQSSASEMHSDVSSAYQIPDVKSALKSQTKTRTSRKALSFGHVPLTPQTPTSILSPGTPDFAFAVSSVVSQSPVPNPRRSHVKRSIAFKRLDNNPSVSSSGDKTPGRSTPLKRKATESILDDSSDSMHPSMSSTPAANNDGMDSIKPSALKSPANPFAKLKEKNKAMPTQNLPFMSPAKAFSSENTPVKVLVDTPNLRTPKRFRFVADEFVTPQLKAVQGCSQTWGSNFQSPRKSNIEPCKLDFDRKPNALEQSETECAKIDEPSKDIALMSPSDMEILSSLPVSLVHSVQEKERKVLEECMKGVAGVKRRQQMIACLPRLFYMIRDLFRTSKRSVITHQELVYKIISSHTEVTDRREVEEQLQLLQQIVPDWISGKKASSGDFLYSIKTNTDVQGIHARLVRAL
eukprot:Gb_04601 [translate_table: standard]